MRSSLLRHAATACVTAFLATSLVAQKAAFDGHVVPVFHDSGMVANDSTLTATQGMPTAIWSTTITVPGAAWLRLHYDAVLLAGSPHRGGDGSFLRITSLLDGAVMTQHMEHVRQWRFTSAYFNGDAVQVEILAAPGTGANLFRTVEVEAGHGPSGAQESICGSTDDRVLSNDARQGRLNVGCTAWLIDDCNHCFLTAGHCTGGSNMVEFNVPLSTSGGSIQHPPPSDQYAIDASSMQSNGGAGTGDDWGYFGVFPNSTTNLTPYTAQGNVSYTLRHTIPPVSGNIRITGYGSTSAPVSPTWYLVQKTHTGPMVSYTNGGANNALVRYSTDTTGGNSGSPIIYENTGEAIGIHTHAGCTSTGGSNQGTGSVHAGLQSALANPRGICATCPGLTFTYGAALPTFVSPAGGDTLRVTVGSNAGFTPQPGTGTFHYDIGNGFQSAPMTVVSTNVYDAVFPAAPCGGTVRYYFSAMDTAGAVFTDPSGGASSAHETTSGAGFSVLVSYDFNTAPAGWSVTNTALTTGAWTRATPSTGGVRGEPANDADGSGQCWITGNTTNEDVDGGPTQILTETFDLSGASDPRVQFQRWFTNDDQDDFFVTSVWNGSTWVTMETVGDGVGWQSASLRIRDFTQNLSQVRFRFSVSDNPNNSVTEGGLDAFAIVDVQCASPTFSTFGAGCAGGSGAIASLSNINLPTLGSNFQVQFQGLAPTAQAALMVIGFGNTTWNGAPLPADLGPVGMPGCSQYITFDDFELSGPVFFGFSTWSKQIPLNTNLAGVRFFLQGFAVDPGAPNALGAVVTDAADCTIQ